MLPQYKHNTDHKQVVDPRANGCVLAAQSCLTLFDPMVCPWILQARILERVATPSSRRSSPPRDRTGVSYTASRFLTIWATREALEQMGPPPLPIPVSICTSQRALHSSVSPPGPTRDSGQCLPYQSGELSHPWVTYRQSHDSEPGVDSNLAPLWCTLATHTEKRGNQCCPKKATL